MRYVIYQNNDFVVMATFLIDKSGWGTDWSNGVKLSAEDVPEEIVIEVENIYQKDEHGELIDISDKAEKYPHYFEVFDTPVVSKNIIDEFNSQGINGFDAYPVVLSYNNKNITGYYLLNINNLVSCLDADKSKCTYIRNMIFRIRELHIDEANIPDTDIFRLKEQKLIKIISEKAKNILKKHSGINIDSADNWSDKVLF